MRASLLNFVLLAGGIHAALFNSSLGQQAPPEPAPAEPSPPEILDADPKPESVQQSPLRTYYLLKKDGSLAPYFTIPFEEFDELYKLYQGISAPDRPPRFVLRDMSITGVVKGEVATLDCSFQIFTKADGWVRVPLGMRGLVLRKSSSRPASSQLLIEFEKDGDGYVCRVRGKQNQTHNVQLTMLAKVQKAGDRSQITLDVPQPSKSSLELIVPGAKIDAFLEGNGVREVQSDGPGKSKVTVVGIGGEVRLGWRGKRMSIETAAPWLNVSSDLLVTVDRQRVVYQAQFQVSSLRTPFKSFLIRVPRDLKVQELTDDQRGYSTNVLPKNDPRAAKAGGKFQLVEVGLSQTTTSAENVLLLAEKARSGNSKAPITISGLEVPDAILHSGELKLSVRQPDSTVHWELPNELRPLEGIPERLRRSNVMARFSYDTKPWSLRVTVAENPNKLRIEPTYFIFVKPEQVTLSARLKCKLTGSNLSNVKVDLRGWTIDEVGPRQWIQAENMTRDQVGSLTIPLTAAAQSSTQEIDLLIQAHRPIDESETALAIPIPRAVDAADTQPTVIVASAGNVALTPDAEKMPELTSTSLPVSLTLPADWPPNQQGLVAYRALGNVASTEFAGQVSRLKQRVSAKMNGVMRLDAQKVAVEQIFALNVENEPLRRLIWSAPASVVESGGLRVVFGKDVELNWKELSGETADSASQHRQVEVDLGEDLLGDFDLTVSYDVTLPSLAVESPQSVTVPMVLPVGVKIQFGALQLPPVRELRASTVGAWRITQLANGDGASQQILELADGQSLAEEISLTIERVADPNFGTLVVEKLWLQSWLLQSDRQDRATFRVFTTEPQIELQLPVGAKVDDIALNGERITDRAVRDQNKVTLPVAQGGGKTEFVIELWYSFNATQSPQGRSYLEAPRIIAGRGPRRFYWQLILPSDEHLLSGPQRLTSEQSWSWQGVYWGRRAALNQRDLENWIGASHQADVPASTNQYLFSSFGAVREIEFQTVSRRTILFTVPLVVFLIGILLFYVSALRHPVALFALGLIIVAFGFVYPELALLVAQVASIGLIFVLAMAVLKWLFARPHRRSAAIHGTSVPSIDVGSTQVQIPADSGGSHSAKSTSSLSVHLSESESNA